MTKSRSPPPPLRFKAGDAVEVSSNEEGFTGAWFGASVVRALAGSRPRYSVVYEHFVDDSDESRPLRETVGAAGVRPRPESRTAGPGGRFCLRQLVDALHNDGWWAGVVSAVLKEGRYKVRFTNTGDEFEYGPQELRLHMDWIDGQWVLPIWQGDPELEFTTGTMVEVSTDDEGFSGAWYNATIVETVEKKFIVEYQDLRTDDETEPLKEVVDALHIRPTPPDTTPVRENFKLLEEVDAFHNDGWWVGVISKVLDGPRYCVYFRSWMEEIEFGHKELRPHQEWIDGTWLTTSQVLG